MLSITRPIHDMHHKIDSKRDNGAVIQGKHTVSKARRNRMKCLVRCTTLVECIIKVINGRKHDIKLDIHSKI